MKNYKFVLAVTLLLLAPAARSMQAGELDHHEAWGLRFAAIPDVLRIHVPSLGRQEIGLLIAKVTPGHPGAELGLRPGDVIMQIDGRAVAETRDLPRPTSATAMLVLRRGQLQMLDPLNTNFSRFLPNGMPPMHGMNLPTRVGVSASSFAGGNQTGGNESVSVSRSGDQFSIDMSLPQLATGPIRLRGTLQEIQKKLSDSKLSATAKQRVLRVIEQNR
jgi:membrane-associated protease RseP (regulator of RpoE activity)